MRGGLDRQGVDPKCYSLGFPFPPISLILFFCVCFLLFFVPICDWFERLVLEESVARGKRDPDGAERYWKCLEQRENDRPFHISLNWHLCSPQRRRHWNSYRCQPDSQTWLCVTLVWKTAAVVSYRQFNIRFKKKINNHIGVFLSLILQQVEELKFHLVWNRFTMSLDSKAKYVKN